jgi:putative ABC transport system permease protein
MLRNYFKTAFRTIRHNKLFSLINIFGLSIGISSALVIYLIVRYEFGFDQFEQNGDRIFRVVSDLKMSGEPFYTPGVPDPLPEAARKDLTGLEEATHLNLTSATVSVPAGPSTRKATFKQQPNIIYADNHYFRLFNFYQWLAGSPASALKDPFCVVLTEDRARTYFPGTPISDIVGRQLFYDDSIRVTVSGIVKVPAVSTDLTFREFISMTTITTDSSLKKSMSVDYWGGISSASQFFVRLSPGTRPAQIDAQLANLRKKYIGGPTDPANTTIHRLQPLSDLHFNATYGSFDQPQANKSALFGLILVAVFLLLLACINFINLTTALASHRAKEIGIRKTFGSSKQRLVLQFLGETFLLTLLSLILSLFLAPSLLRIFSDFIPPDLHFGLGGPPALYIFLAPLLLVVTLLSGFYPALILSRFRPVLVLKNQLHSSTATTRSAWLRKMLTTFQFVIAQCFIMATLLVGHQIRFSIDSDLGFKKEGIVYFQTPGHNKENQRSTLLNKIRSLPGVSMVATGVPPSSSGTGTKSMEYNNGKTTIETQVQVKQGDTNYLALYHIRLLAGRNFRSGDTTRQLIVNQTFARLLGFADPQNAVGKSVVNGKPFPIIGVVADFHQASMHTAIKPLIITCENNGSLIDVALQAHQAGAGWNATLAQIQTAYRQLYPENDFSYQFFDERIAKFYASEQRISRLLQWATGLTILISCLGLTGLVIYTTAQRTKEIGIRKVLGASVTGIVTLLTKDYIRLMGIAFLIATPIAWWSMRIWLNDFAYRAPVNWWLFPLSGALLMAIALAAISIRTFRTATANPVDSLRSE